MWPFKQQKTDSTTAYEEHLDELRGAFGVPKPTDPANSPRTADGHRLDEMVVCFDCGQLVLRGNAKAVEHRYPQLRFTTLQGWREVPQHPDQTFYHCQAHAPIWDVAAADQFGVIGHYRRIAAVPERLEEIVEAPVKVARKRKPKKGAN